MHVPNRGAEGVRPDEDAGGDVANNQGQPEPLGHDPPQEGGHQNKRDVASYSHGSTHTLLRSPNQSFAEDGAPAFAPAGGVVDAVVYPTALQYPGAPRSRWWEIEDAAVDIGGYPPDTSHFPTTLLIDLIASHGDDWFLFPVDARGGHILTLRTVTVTDAFGESYPLTPPADWWLFKTTGLDLHSLVV